MTNPDCRPEEDNCVHEDSGLILSHCSSCMKWRCGYHWCGRGQRNFRFEQAFNKLDVPIQKELKKLLNDLPPMQPQEYITFRNLDGESTGVPRFSFIGIRNQKDSDNIEVYYWNGDSIQMIIGRSEEVQ
jgi:hypothetical protein